MLDPFIDKSGADVPSVTLDGVSFQEPLSRNGSSMEQNLIDDVLVRVPLILDNDRAVVLVDTESVDSTGVIGAGHILRREKPDSK